MTFNYEVIHSDRSTIRITVERDQKIVVRVPKQASEQTVSAAVESKRFWIWQKIRDPHKFPDPAPRKEYVPGETFLYLGQNHGLHLIQGRFGMVRLVGDQFEMGRLDRRDGNALFRAWYLSRAKEKLRPRVAAFALEMGVACSRVQIRDLQYRWGSCTPGGTLTFNWRIIQAPSIVLDYLIVHELAHVLEPNHSREFWNIVAIHAPSWQKSRTWLKENGNQLQW